MAMQNKIFPLFFTLERVDNGYILTAKEETGGLSEGGYRKEVVVDDKDKYLFFSDFYNGLENMSDTVTLSLKSDGENHSYKIYAVDSWGEKSENFVTIGEN